MSLYNVLEFNDSDFMTPPSTKTNGNAAKNVNAQNDNGNAPKKKIPINKSLRAKSECVTLISLFGLAGISVINGFISLITQIKNNATKQPEISVPIVSIKNNLFAAEGAQPLTPTAVVTKTIPNKTIQVITTAIGSVVTAVTSITFILLLVSLVFLAHSRLKRTSLIMPFVLCPKEAFKQCLPDDLLKSIGDTISDKTWSLLAAAAILAAHDMHYTDATNIKKRVISATPKCLGNLQSSLLYAESLYPGSMDTIITLAAQAINNNYSRRKDAENKWHVCIVVVCAVSILSAISGAAASITNIIKIGGGAMNIATTIFSVASALLTIALLVATSISIHCNKKDPGKDLLQYGLLIMDEGCGLDSRGFDRKYYDVYKQDVIDSRKAWYQTKGKTLEETKPANNLKFGFEFECDCVNILVNAPGSGFKPEQHKGMKILCNEYVDASTNRDRPSSGERRQSRVGNGSGSDNSSSPGTKLNGAAGRKQSVEGANVA